MPHRVLTVFLAAALLVILLGSKQSRPRDRYALAAAALVALLAAGTAVTLGGTPMFGPAALAIAALQAAHHLVAYFAAPSALPDLSSAHCAAPVWAVGPVHVTGIAVAATAGAVSMLRL